MTNIIPSNNSNFGEGFNFDALHKAYKTGILNKEDFANDEHWATAIDIFSSEMNEELEIPPIGTDTDTDLQDGLQMVEDFTNPASNPNNWGLSPLRDAALRRQMALDPDWDAKQLSAELDPEIDRMINEFNNRNAPEEYKNGVVFEGGYLFKTEAEKQRDIADSEAMNDLSNSEYPYLVPSGFSRYSINDGTGLYPYDGDPNNWEGEIHGSNGDILPKSERNNTRYFGDFQADYEDFDWDNNYTETGFPDGQFLANGLDAPASAFLAECWRSHNTDGAYDYIEMIADDELRERISRVYDNCDGTTVDRSQFEFAWEQETLSDVCDDPYGLGD